jgi:hypothetical protein
LKSLPGFGKIITFASFQGFEKCEAYIINLPRQQYHHWSLSNCWDNNFNITWKPEPIVMKLGMYIMHATWRFLGDVNHESLPSVIPVCSERKAGY